MNIFELGEKNPNYLGSVDLIDLNPKELVLTIQNIYEESIESARGTTKCTVCAFRENFKPMILNPTNKKTLCRLFNTKEIERMTGRRITVAVKKEKAFGKITDCLRIGNELPKEEAILCAACGKAIQHFGTKSAAEIAAYTKQKYGNALCAACAAEKNAKSEREVQA